MKKQKCLLLLLVAAMVFALAACGADSPEDETAYIVISLGGGASRTAVPWNTSLDDEAIPHDIKIGGTIVSGVHINESDKLKIPVSAGTHAVEVRGYDPADPAILISYAEDTVAIAAGQTVRKEIKLRQAFETSTTPWTDAVSAINAGGNPDKFYYIIVNDTFTIAGTTTETFGSDTGITVNIRGTGKISLSSNGSLLMIGSGQTVSLKDAHLEGTANTSQSQPIVYVQGTFIMESGKISGNYRQGVAVEGMFTMSGGEISGNNTYGRASGGGVYVTGGTFNMSGTAKIINNGNSSVVGRTYYGGGVGVFSNAVGAPAIFNMSGNAEISGNCLGSGGGVGVYSNAGGATATFNMSGGTIMGNTANGNNPADFQEEPFGGGASVVSKTGGTATFNMTGGTITGNNIYSIEFEGGFGGGVGVCNNGAAATFTMTGGTITGNTAAGDISRGGGVNAGWRSTFELKSLDMVKNNTATDLVYFQPGKEIYVRDNATFTINGSAAPDSLWDDVNYGKGDF